jgi:hypothetical protein
MSTTVGSNSLPVPQESDSPDVPVDMSALAVAIDKRLAGVYNDATDRNTRISAPQEGQLAYLKDTNLWTYYDGSAWQTVVPTLPAFSSGSSVPSNTSGSNGDVFFKV